MRSAQVIELKRDILSVLDMKDDFEQILNEALKMKSGQKKTQKKDPLKGKVLGMVFEKPSLRTRMSFEVGMTQLGGSATLFIRETTYVDHHSFRFSRRAEAEGLVVIDDPQSILRCTNKVFLAEAFARRGSAVRRRSSSAPEMPRGSSERSAFPAC